MIEPSKRRKGGLISKFSKPLTAKQKISSVQVKLDPKDKLASGTKKPVVALA